MTTKYSPPELRAKKLDLVVAAVVLVLAAFVAVGFYGPKLGHSDGLTAVISVGGEEIERIDLRRLGGEKLLTVEGECTLHVLLTSGGAEVIFSDCPSQDCVHTGHIARPGQSIVCLPGQVVVHLEGAAAGGPDVIVG